jgi:hypothetical protein
LASALNTENGSKPPLVGTDSRTQRNFRINKYHSKKMSSKETQEPPQNSNPDFRRKMHNYTEQKKSRMDTPTESIQRSGSHNRDSENQTPIKVKKQESKKRVIQTTAKKEKQTKIVPARNRLGKRPTAKVVLSNINT